MKYSSVIEDIHLKTSRKALMKSVKPEYKGENKDFEKAKKIMLQEDRIISEISNYILISKNISNKMDLRDTVIITDILMDIILHQPDYFYDEDMITEKIIETEKEIIRNAESFRVRKSDDATKYKKLLEFAWEDGEISTDEFILLRKAMTLFNLTIHEKWYIETKLNKFPCPKNILHTHQDIKDVINYLRSRAILFHIKHHNSEIKGHIIPEEIANVLRNKIYGIEIQRDNFKKLLSNKLLFKSTILNSICRKYEISGASLEKKVEGIINSGISAREILTHIHEHFEEDFKNIAAETKATHKTLSYIITHIIQFYDKLPEHKPNHIDARSDCEELLEYYEDLAKRDSQYLIKKGVIPNDSHIGSTFEAATKYLFEKYLKANAFLDPNSSRPDFGYCYNRNSILIGDCKTSLNVTKNKNHTSYERQFTNYINDYKKIPNKELRAFLVIVPSTNETSEQLCVRIKVKTDIDVAIVTAKDFLELSRYWVKQNKPLNMEIFNFQGILDFELLKKRIKQLTMI